MSVMYIVLPLALLFAAIFVGMFIWAVKHGQMDDLHTPAARILLDDDDPAPRPNPQAQAPSKKTATSTAPDTLEKLPDETVSHDEPNGE